MKVNTETLGILLFLVFMGVLFMITMIDVEKRGIRVCKASCEYYDKEYYSGEYKVGEESFCWCEDEEGVRDIYN